MGAVLEWVPDILLRGSQEKVTRVSWSFGQLNANQFGTVECNFADTLAVPTRFFGVDDRSVVVVPCEE